MSSSTPAAPTPLDNDDDDVDYPTAGASCQDLCKWLRNMIGSYPNGPRLHIKPVAHVDSKAKNKAKQHQYTRYYKEGDLLWTPWVQPKEDKDGKPVPVDPNAEPFAPSAPAPMKRKILAGGMYDSQEYDCISNFLTHATEGKNIQVAYFVTSMASASDPSGHTVPQQDGNSHPGYAVRNKATAVHGWVGVIAKRISGGKGLYIYDSDAKNLPLRYRSGKGWKLKGRKEALNSFQMQLFGKVKERRVHDVYLWPDRKHDDECAYHSARFIESLMERGDNMVGEDKFFDKFVHLNVA
jgi:hypothetical protein